MTQSPGRSLRIGTRGSPMALAQAARVARALAAAGSGRPAEVVPVRGGRAAASGKERFVKAVDEALARGAVDLVVHCLKDMPGNEPPPEGMVLAAVLTRDDVRDVFVVPAGSTVARLSQLAPGARIGTSSVRRAAQLRRLRPDVRVVEVHGTVGTRLAKLDDPDGGLDALVVAAAGLDRLGLGARARQVFALTQLLPAVGAGVLALGCRTADTAVREVLAGLNDPVTWTHAAAERAVLRELRGHCGAPVAGHCATGRDGRLSLRALVLRPDGSRTAAVHLRGADAAELGGRAARELLRQGARELLDG